MSYAKFKNEYELGDGSPEYRLGTISFPLNRKFQIDYYHKLKERSQGRRLKWQMTSADTNTILAAAV